MKHLAIALFASVFVVGCGFVDDNIHMSDEELEAEMSLGSGSIGMSGRAIHSSGCGGVHMHSHHSRHYDFGASSIRGRRPTINIEHSRAVGGIAPRQTVPAGSAVEAEPESEQPTADPVPRNVDTWGQLLEWHFRNAQQRGEVDDQTVAAMNAMAR